MSVIHRGPDSIVSASFSGTYPNLLGPLWSFKLGCCYIIEYASGSNEYLLKFCAKTVTYDNGPKIKRDA